jgi:hypothetical protein
MKQSSPKHGCRIRQEGRFELAVGGTFLAVALGAAVIGALVPLWAALAVGLIASWIGEAFDHHLVAPVPAWRIFGCAGTLGAAIGWIIACAAGWRAPTPWAPLAGTLVGLAIVILALLCRSRHT